MITKFKKLVLLSILIFNFKALEAVIQTIKIGAIFHKGDDKLENAFDHVLEELSPEKNSFYILKAIKKRNVDIETFEIYNVTCELIQEGVAAIFGPKYYLTRNVVSRIAARFDIPHIEFSYRHRDEKNERTKSINVYPSSILYEKAIAEVVRHMTWSSYTYIYQTNDALSRIQEAIQNKFRPNDAITVRELMPLSEIKALKTEKERKNVYESIVKEIVLSNQLKLLLDIEKDNLAEMFSTMSQMNLISDYLICLITTLDSRSLPLEQFVDKNSIANITRFEFLHPNKTKNETVEEALLYDAVYAFSEALTTLYKDVNSLDDSEKDDKKYNIEPPPLTCQGDTDKISKYAVGPNITSIFLKRTKWGKKTGLMTFNENGERNFEMIISNYQAGRSTELGYWKDGTLHLSRNEEAKRAVEEQMKNKTFKVVTKVGSPYVMEAEYEIKGETIQINGKYYQGYCIDLINKIQKYLGISFQWDLVPDGNYGSKNPRTKMWDGLIKQLLELKADLAICDLTITSERQSAVDFTAPFMNLGISILFSKQEKPAPELFSFMHPLSTEVWIYMMTAFLAVSLMLFIQARFAPGEWINPHPCNTDPDELENSFTLMNSMWLTMGSLMQQGCDILPRTPSIRMIAGLWWFFVLIMVSSYTANLAAFLTATKLEDSISNVEDLAKQTKISYGAVKGGSTHSFFKNSNNSINKRLYLTMNDAKPPVFTDTNDDGVKRVLKGKRKYAFFMESTSIEYQVQRHCELQQVGNLLDNKGYGIALPPNSPYRTRISTAVLHLQENGELRELKEKWWKTKGGGICNESDEPSDSNELGMSHVGGVFIVLGIGCAISFFIGVIEFLWNIRIVAIKEKITPIEALIQEWKFIINIRATTKPVKTAKSSSKSTSFKKSSNSINNSTPSLLNTLDFKNRTNNKDGQELIERT